VEAILIRKTLILLPMVLIGCHAHHYMVVEDRAPLYAGPKSDTVIARLPRYHHEELSGSPSDGKRVLLSYKGRLGYAPRAKLRLFDYLDPKIDDGEARDRAVRHELREATLANVGSSWSRQVVSAIRRDEVIRGMTRRQVEVAWGWPVTVQPGALPGGERWVYVSHTTSTIRQYLSDPWAYPSSCSPYLPAGISGYSPFQRPWRREGWVELRLPVTEERLVELNADGRVASARVRRYVQDL
jgi:outer membrane protein assembly factor BamE (lipoprotein component of BamABCDE complex)